MIQTRYPARVNGAFPLPVRQLGAISIATPEGRNNLINLSTGIAMAGGGIYAIMRVKGARKSDKISLGAIGGGLLVGSLLSIYNSIA